MIKALFRTIQHAKYGTKYLMITFVVKRKNVMFHIKNWIKLFVDMYNKEVIMA
jgi:hypothetical protein